VQSRNGTPSEKLAARQPAYQSKGEAPPEHLPKDIPPTPKVHLHDNGTMTITSMSMTQLSPLLQFWCGEGILT